MNIDINDVIAELESRANTLREIARSLEDSEYHLADEYFDSANVFESAAELLYKTETAP